MKKILMMWLFVVMAVSATSQTITIKDMETELPLVGVTLHDAAGNFATTDVNGEAVISQFEGSEEIAIRMLGYREVFKSFNQLSENPELFLKRSNFDMDEFVVSATRWKQGSRDVPARITSVSPEDVALQNPQTAADLLGTSGEVFVQKSQQGGGSPMIRGFSTNRLLYAVDGIRMNTAIFRSGNLQNVISLDPFAMESTEVLFGPGSVIYGSDAIGGVMSFQTLTPQFSQGDSLLVKGNAIARFSSANQEKTGHFDVNVGGQKWSFLSSVSYTDFGDLRMGKHGPDEYLRNGYVERQEESDVIVPNETPRVQVPSGYSQINTMQKIRFRPNEKWDFEYAFHYSETSEYDRYDRLIELRDDMPRSAEWRYGPQIWMMNNLKISHHANNTLYDEMTIRLAYQEFEESRIDRAFNRDMLRTRVEEVAAYSANVDFLKTLSEKNTLFYGAEAVVNDVTSSGSQEDITTGAISDAAPRYPMALWSSYGAYLTNQYQANDKLMIQSGVRYNQYVMDAAFDTTFYPLPFEAMQINNGELSGSAGFVYRPERTWEISMNAATGFRAPNVDDAGKVFDSEPGAVVVPNPDLQAERVYNADLGVAKIFNDVVKLDFTGYYTILENALVRRNYTLDGQDSIMYDGFTSRVQAIQNAAMSTVYGVQAGIEVRLSNGLSFMSRFNYQKGEEEMDDGTVSASRHAPPWFGVTRLTYRKDKLLLELYSMYSGEQSFENMPIEERGKIFIYATDENGNPYSPAWHTLNFKAMYQVVKYLSVTVGMENITDQRYRPYSSGIVAPGRNVIVSLRGNF